ncbi:MAG TPA: zinc-binding dehydrogenase [Sphingobium sp.]
MTDTPPNGPLHTPSHGLELRSLVTADGVLRLSLDPVEIGEPGPDELVVRVEATPINPSDLGLLLGPADLATLRREGEALVADVPQARLAALSARLGTAMPVGNEGAGTVVQAGADVQHLLGQRVGMLGGAMYATYRRIAAQACIPLPDGASAADGASLFVNPLTALSMVEVLRREGHTALIHTAAASNLGQMLVRLCLADGIELVNIVRSPAQVALLRGIGARHVVDSSAADFAEALTAAVTQTGATLAFDAVGGGSLANTILHAMEAAANDKAPGYSRYGSATYKQVYIYGGLDTGPTLIDRGFGLSWGVGGFLLTPFLAGIGAEAAQGLRDRVARDLTTIFASRYSRTISLADALDPHVAADYARRATGEKMLIDPSL